MKSENFIVRQLREDEINNFVAINAQAGFCTQNSCSMPKIISLAEYNIVIENNKKIVGCVMVFKRWEDALWATNIYVDPSMKEYSLSTLLYRSVLKYAFEKNFKWVFCNPANRRVAMCSTQDGEQSQ